MNTCANLAGGLAPVVTARIATRIGWSQALDFAAIVSFTAGLIWLFVDADSNLENETSSANGNREILVASGTGGIVSPA